ncbi:MAG: RNA-binding transcriptional accessory protein [Alphaproteobacteria bacterium]|nr:RNA-binding transcriptional accessory protein [Alphaproteobacteria bacterium]
MKSVSARIAEELNVQETQVLATVDLLDGGATVPFVARYRKEATGGLDDIQLRALEERLRYLRELEERRSAIISSIQEQDKMTDDLRIALQAADSKARLEDLYLPYKPKRRTKAQIAREAGLEPLAEALWANPTLDPEAEAQNYLRPDVADDTKVVDTDAALDGAKQILAERFAEDAELIGALREYIWENANLVSRVVKGQETAGAKFQDYFEYAEAVKKVPSHRALAVFRGGKEEVLRNSLAIGDPDTPPRPHPCEQRIAKHFGILDQGRPADPWLLSVASWTWRVKASLHIELELMGRLWSAAEEEGIHVFAENLRDLLLAAPAGARATIALDPGYRSGVKVAVVDATGKLVDTTTIYPHEPRRQWDEAIMVIAALAVRHQAELISIGNGTASRETDKMAAELIKAHPELGLTKVMVSEAGASVYSASEYASNEFPDVDVSLRGAASIGRRLQDPLAELVKIEPKAIGVGQYQHDLSEYRLGRALDAVVEDCVNAVGVDLNMASSPLLARVSGLGAALARNIVDYRDAHGAFASRDDLKKVPMLGAKTFEQCAGFLRITGGDNPLDRSSVHPEAYPLVERILEATKMDVHHLIGDTHTLDDIAPGDFTDDRFGEVTVRDIIAELKKPGRDPRPEFKTATFKDGVEKVSDLKPGMILEGVVTNVANFGAFVDVGVHQDGLVHISQLSNVFVKDPRDVVKPGDVVKVKVQEIDLPRKRISLTMKMGEGHARPGLVEPQQKPAKTAKTRPRAQARPAQTGRKKGQGEGGSKGEREGQRKTGMTALAEAFNRARK